MGILNDMFLGGAQRNAGRTMRNASQSNNLLFQDYMGRNNARLQPYEEAGKNALTDYRSAIDNRGAGPANFNYTGSQPTAFNTNALTRFGYRGGANNQPAMDNRQSMGNPLQGQISGSQTASQPPQHLVDIMKQRGMTDQDISSTWERDTAYNPNNRVSLDPIERNPDGSYSPRPQSQSMGTPDQYSQLIANRPDKQNAGQPPQQQPLASDLPTFNQRERFSFDPSQITSNPAYQFRLDQGTDLVNRQASKGFRGSGNRMIDLMDFGQGLASTEYDNEWKRQLDTSNTNYGRGVDEYGMDTDRANTTYNRGLTEYDIARQAEQEKYGRELNQNALNNTNEATMYGRDQNRVNQLGGLVDMGQSAATTGINAEGNALGAMAGANTDAAMADAAGRLGQNEARRGLVGDLATGYGMYTGKLPFQDTVRNWLNPGSAASSFTPDAAGNVLFSAGGTAAAAAQGAESLWGAGAMSQPGVMGAAGTTAGGAAGTTGAASSLAAAAPAVAALAALAFAPKILQKMGHFAKDSRQEAKKKVNQIATYYGMNDLSSGYAMSDWIMNKATKSELQNLGAIMRASVVGMSKLSSKGKYINPGATGTPEQTQLQGMLKTFLETGQGDMNAMGELSKKIMDSMPPAKKLTVQDIKSGGVRGGTW